MFKDYFFTNNLYFDYFMFACRKLKKLSKDEIKDLINSSSNYTYIFYTYLHQNKVNELAKQLHLKGFPHHDMDKLILYLTLDNKKQIHNIHRKIARHHDRTNTDVFLLLEMLCDWESARYTKPDKSLNCIETLNAYYPDMKDRMLPLIALIEKDWDLTDFSISNVDFYKMIKETNIDDIVDKIYKYLHFYIQ